MDAVPSSASALAGLEGVVAEPAQPLSNYPGVPNPSWMPGSSGDAHRADLAALVLVADVAYVGDLKR